jgi:hypothetical protein
MPFNTKSVPSIKHFLQILQNVEFTFTETLGFKVCYVARLHKRLLWTNEVLRSENKGSMCDMIYMVLFHWISFWIVRASAHFVCSCYYIQIVYYVCWLVGFKSRCFCCIGEILYYIWIKLFDMWSLISGSIFL